MPDPKTFKQHFENKHPSAPLPEELKDAWWLNTVAPEFMCHFVCRIFIYLNISNVISIVLITLVLMLLSFGRCFVVVLVVSSMGWLNVSYSCFLLSNVTYICHFGFSHMRNVYAHLLGSSLTFIITEPLTILSLSLLQYYRVHFDSIIVGLAILGLCG